MRKSLNILRNSLRLTLQELKVNKLRTALSLTGVAFGIFCIIGVLATVNSLERNIQNEVNTLEFIVERSTDGRNYTAIGSVASANSTGIHYYNFTDLSATSQGASILYYRLKQKEFSLSLF